MHIHDTKDRDPVNHTRQLVLDHLQSQIVYVLAQITFNEEDLLLNYTEN